MADPKRQNVESGAVPEVDLKPQVTEQNLSSPEALQSIETPQVQPPAEGEPVQENDETAPVQLDGSMSQSELSPESILSDVSTVQETDNEKTSELLTDDNKLDPKDSSTAHQMLEDIINDGKQ